MVIDPSHVDWMKLFLDRTGEQTKNIETSLNDAETVLKEVRFDLFFRVNVVTGFVFIILIFGNKFLLKNVFVTFNIEVGSVVTYHIYNMLHIKLHFNF